MHETDHDLDHVDHICHLDNLYLSSWCVVQDLSTVVHIQPRRHALNHSDYADRTVASRQRDLVLWYADHCRP